MKSIERIWANFLVVAASVPLNPAGWVGLLLVAVVVH